MRRTVGLVAVAIALLAAAPATAAPAGTGSSSSGTRVAVAVNWYGPGIGPQTKTKHWGGAYSLVGVPGYGYCIQPGDADPVELPFDRWSPTTYPGSAVYTDGQMAALAYLAARYQTTGFFGYSADDTAAAIAQVAYASAGGVTPPASQAPAPLVAEVEAWIRTFAGPWRIAITMTPPPGSTYLPNTNYSGTVTITSATGAGIEGLGVAGPLVGGPTNGQVSNFVWLAPATNAAGQISFQWNIDAIPPGAGQFSASMSLDTGGVGTAPPTYAAPAGSNGQRMLVSGSTEPLVTGFGGTVQQPVAATGTLSIQKTVPDAAYYGPGGAVFQVLNGAGSVVDTLTTGPTGATPVSVALTTVPAGEAYTLHETAAPPGYLPAPDRTVTVLPFQNTAVRYSGSSEEPVDVAQLGALKVDAQTGAALAGATFTFRFDAARDGVFSEDLGSCTTGTTGTCQPPVENAAGGWLPGNYQVQEIAAPPGYWLDPATAVQTVTLAPGATTVASVTFSDPALGSLMLNKSGNDTAYLPIAGATFSVSGPAPSTGVVGVLTVGSGGTSNTLGGLVPGTYTVTETAPPSGYTAVPPFQVAVASGHATTSVTVTDPVRAASIVVEKVDATTGAPLAGATFDTRYDSHHNGVFDVDLGPCTTGASGTCTPPPNDGSGFLPGTYQVTETVAPPGYVLPPNPVKILSVPAAGSVAFAFADPKLVAAAFVKSAVGNVDPSQLSLAGAVIDVTAGTSAGGPTVASCTTAASGTCTTPPVLVAGQHYCWTEVTAPTGLAAGATGCFTASDAQASQPIPVVDNGMFVAVRARKIDATNAAVAVAGATFDLYRVGGPAVGTAPPDAVPVAGQVWVARSTTGPTGSAAFPLQLPGYAYCTLEHAAPPDYVADPTEQCTRVLTGSTTTPPATTTITTADPEATVTLSARKYNAASPSTVIPGAVYDLYVEGAGPPSGPPSSAPPGAASIPGDTWWGRGTTTGAGLLQFTVPAGYAWCLKEVAAPANYVLDVGLHCTAVLTVGAPATTTTIALPETLASVTISTHKYNALQPGTTIPGAIYELVGEGTPPPGWRAPSGSAPYPVPAGDWYAGVATTDAQGAASWTVPAGSAWCVHEVSAPPGYQFDRGWHCTGTVSTASPPTAAVIALPELPVAPIAAATASAATLAFTGGPPLWILGAAVVLVLAGSALVAVSRRRRPDRRHGR